MISFRKMSLRWSRANLAVKLILALAGWAASGAEEPKVLKESPEKQTAPTAPPPAVKLKPYVRLVERLYQEGQFDAVMIGVRPAGGSSELDSESLAQLAVLEGMVQVDLVQEAAARDAFKRAFALNYDVALPSYASSKTAQLFQATQAEYRKTNARPIPKPPEPKSNGEEWKWGLVGGGAAGAVAGIVVLAGSNGQQNTVGGALLGAGTATAIAGIIALSIQAPRSGSAVSLAVTPRGDVLAVCTGRF